jgi:hypothetical protein
MKISGFTFVRNAVRLYYPVVESIRSILPIVDEFVVAAGDSDDGTTELIRSIDDPKVKIIETVWDLKSFDKGVSNSEQTNIALDSTSGDWAFYLQADEVVHERFLDPLVKIMEKHLDNKEVEGFLFDYLHFYAGYDLVQTARNWYRHEVRVIRNGAGIRSWESAQGFRRDGNKINVVRSGAEVYHYGWVRPPVQMTRKQAALATVHHGEDWVGRHYPNPDVGFNYGTLKTVKKFGGTHPAVMAERIAARDWEVKPGPPQKSMPHDRLSVRMLSWIENKVLKKRIGEYKNYVLID